jgi:hypothetical protein
VLNYIRISAILGLFAVSNHLKLVHPHPKHPTLVSDRQLKPIFRSNRIYSITNDVTRSSHMVKTQFHEASIGPDLELEARPHHNNAGLFCAAPTTAIPN